MKKALQGEPITLDELARIINTSFEGVQKNFKSVREDVAKDLKLLDSKIDALELVIKEESRLTREEVRKWNFSVEIDALENHVSRNFLTLASVSHARANLF